VTEACIAALESLQPVALLAARAYLASVFFRSGLTKLADWGTTLALFSDEYHVPWLTPEVAAWLGTSSELALPVLLLVGFAGRFASVGLFILNAVAVVSLQEIAPAALQQHIFWGCLLAGLLLWGMGGLSVDRIVAPRLRRLALGSPEPTGAARLGSAAVTDTR
jgi:putative oxidoreductase